MTTSIDPPKPQRRPLAKLVPHLLLTTAYFWIPALLFLALAYEVHGNKPLDGEVAILNWFHSISSPLLNRIMIYITDLGSAQVVVVGVLLAASALAYTQRRRQALFLLFCAGGTAAINVITKHIFQRDRPSLWTQVIVENGYSFPSGHAMISSALALSVAILVWKTRYRWYVIAVSVAYFLLVGISRLYLGVHYPTDVLAGWCVSILWVMAVHHTFEIYGRRHETRSS